MVDPFYMDQQLLAATGGPKNPLGQAEAQRLRSGGTTPDRPPRVSDRRHSVGADPTRLLTEPPIAGLTGNATAPVVAMSRERTPLQFLGTKAKQPQTDGHNGPSTPTPPMNGHNGPSHPKPPTDGHIGPFNLPPPNCPPGPFFPKPPTDGHNGPSTPKPPTDGHNGPFKPQLPTDGHNGPSTNKAPLDSLSDFEEFRGRMSGPLAQQAPLDGAAVQPAISDTDVQFKGYSGDQDTGFQSAQTLPLGSILDHKQDHSNWSQTPLTHHVRPPDHSWVNRPPGQASEGFHSYAITKAVTGISRPVRGFPTNLYTGQPWSSLHWWG